MEWNTLLGLLIAYHHTSIALLCWHGGLNRLSVALKMGLWILWWGNHSPTSVCHWYIATMTVKAI